MNQTSNNPRMNFVNRLLAGNPQLRNNPMAHNALSAIQNGDDATGEQIARNLCESLRDRTRGGLRTGNAVLQRSLKANGR